MSGANRSLLELVRHQDRESFPLTVAFTSLGEATESFQREGYDVRVLGAGPGLHGFGRSTATLKIFLSPAFWRDLFRFNWSFWRWLRRERFDLVHARDSRSLLLLAPAIKLARKPLVTHVRGDMPKRRWMSWLTGFLPDQILLVYARLEDQIPHLFRHKCVVAYGGISETSVDETQQEPSGQDEEDLEIVTLANVTPEKGLEFLVAALVELDERSLHVPETTVVGDTEINPAYSRSLMREVEERHLPVRFVGWQEKPGAFLKRARTVVLPSRSEGLPRALLEAMFAGKPVISTRVGGIPELIEHGKSGLLVEPEDPSDLASAIALLQADPELRIRLSKEGKKRVRDEFSSLANARRVEAVYSRMLAGRRRAS